MADGNICHFCDALVQKLISNSEADWGDDIAHHHERSTLSSSASICSVCHLFLRTLDQQPDFLYNGEPADPNYRYEVTTSFARPFAVDLTAAGGWTYCCHLCRSHATQTSSCGGIRGTDVTSKPQNGLIVPGRLIHRDSDSFGCQDLAKYWLDQCMQHENCQRNLDAELPTRLLDLGSLDGSGNLKLANLSGQKGTYVTLSYCWGGQVPLRLLCQSLSSFELSIPFNSLPALFQDTVKIIRSLGIQYLWIDALCIIQDDAQDWAREAAQMHKVYANSLFTISATAARNPVERLFGSRAVDYVELPPTYSVLAESYSGEPVFLCALGDMSSSSTNFESPVNDRAWILQERILTPALLHFSHEQLVWECRTGRFHEDGHHEQVDAFTKSPLLSEALLESPHAGILDDMETQDEYYSWYEIVKDYTRRKLTYGTDRLPAVAGLASTVAKHVKSDYLAGIWKEDLPRGLLWQGMHMSVVKPTQQMHRSLVKPIQQTKDINAPSWTWAHLDGPVWYQYADKFINAETEDGFDVEIISAEVDFGDGGPFGHVRGGEIHLIGLLQPTWYDHTTLRFTKDCDSLIYSRMDTVTDDRSRDCFLLLVGTSGAPTVQTFFLVLVEAGQTPAQYRRIGIACRDAVGTTIDDEGNDERDGENFDPESFFSSARREKVILV